MDCKRNIMNFKIVFMFLCTSLTNAAHVEVEEFIEKYQRQTIATTTTTESSLTTALQLGEQNGDPGTESVCKYMGECGGPAHKPCPVGSACENIPEIKANWCCKIESQTGTDSKHSAQKQQKANAKKSKKPRRLPKNIPSKLTDRPGRKTNGTTRTRLSLWTPPKRKYEVRPSIQTHTANLRIRCNGAPLGKCGGPSKSRCPAYSQCSFVNPVTGVGICCRTRPSCPRGFMGTCNIFSGEKCPGGSTCKCLPGETNGWCCRQNKETGKCPNGADGVCGTHLSLKCRHGTTCRYKQRGMKDASGKCCIDNPKEAFCPSGDVRSACSAHKPCEPGFSCRYGFCCRDETCPKRWIKGGYCNRTPGAPTCPKGYKCIDGACCRVPEIVCPSGVLGSTCSTSKRCKLGYMCRFGKCCQI